MPKPIDPQRAQAETLRDHQYRIERLEKLLAICEAQLAAAALDPCQYPWEQLGS